MQQQNPQKLLVKGDNGYYVTKDANGKLHYYSPDKKEISPEEFKEVCPNIYENVNKTEEEKAAEKKAKYEQSVREKAYAADAASRFYRIYNENNGNTCCKKMLQLLKERVTTKNIVDFLDSANYPATRGKHSSIIGLVGDIKTASRGKKEDVVSWIMNTLVNAAFDRGVSKEDRDKAETDFYDAMYDGFNVGKMEAAIDFLRGCIAAREVDNKEEISDSEAMDSFNESNKVRQDEAQGVYDEAKGDGWSWTAKTGDWVCGLFGCKTIEEMEAKLGKSAGDVKRLAQAKSYNEFKVIYKQIFGIEFDKEKIAAREAALANYQQARACVSTIEIINRFRGSLQTMDYATLKNQIMSKFEFNEKTLDQIVENYSKVFDLPNNNETDKITILRKFLSETLKEAETTFEELSKGRTIQRMERDLDLIHRSAFGTSDLAKEVAEFANNMVITEMVTEGAFEIAGTIALQFVPGLGQAAAARLAVSTARWGAKGLKIAKAAQKAQKAFAAVNKVTNGSTVARTVTVATNAATATLAVDLSNGDSVKDAFKKAIMNASFAAAGVTASTLAPKIMQAFGITNKVLAIELAEEILNATAVQVYL